MMKKFFLFFLLHVFNFNYVWSQDILLGEETVDRIRFPKFYFMYGYGVFGNAYDLNTIIKQKTISKGYYALGNEHNLYKYINAGFKFSFFMDKLDLDGSDRELSSYKINLSIFAKPFLPITDIISFYTKFGGGFGSSFAYPTHKFMRGGSKEQLSATYDMYGDSIYSNQSLPSVNTSISVGIDYFLFSRFGIFLESTYLGELNLGKNQKVSQNRNEIKSGPNYFWFMNQSVILSSGLSFIF